MQPLYVGFIHGKRVDRPQHPGGRDVILQNMGSKHIIHQEVALALLLEKQAQFTIVWQHMESNQTYSTAHTALSTRSMLSKARIMSLMATRALHIA
jgi:hypothetical protein